MNLKKQNKKQNNIIRRIIKYKTNKKLVNCLCYMLFFTIGSLCALFISHASVNIKQVYIIGCKYFPSSEIKNLANHILNQQKDIHYLQQAILELDYIQNVNVTLNLKGQLFIYVKERTPLVGTSEGDIISADFKLIKSLPIFKPTLLKVQFHPYLLQDPTQLEQLLEVQTAGANIQLAIFVRLGRWNLIIDNKLIKLHDGKVKQGLQILQHFINTHPADYALAKEIDLRKLGYVIIKTNADLAP